MTTTVTRIRFGFLDGNLLGGDRDLDGLDQAASVKAYAEIMEERLRETFPGVEVEVVHQNASGSIPFGCHTVADDEDGNECQATEATIHAIAEEVFESGSWVVEAEPETLGTVYVQPAGEVPPTKTLYVVHSKTHGLVLADADGREYGPKSPAVGYNAPRGDSNMTLVCDDDVSAETRESLVARGYRNVVARQ